MVGHRQEESGSVTHVNVSKSFGIAPQLRNYQFHRGAHQNCTLGLVRFHSQKPPYFRLPAPSPMAWGALKLILT